MELINDRKYWGWSFSLIITLFVLFFSQLAASLVLIFIHTFKLLFLGQLSIFELLHLANISFETIQIKNTHIISVAYPIFGMYVLWVLIRFKNISIRDYLNLNFPRISIGLVFGFFLLIVFYEYISKVFPDVFKTDFVIETYTQVENLPLLYLGIVLLVPIFEEFLFRGFLFKGLEKSFIGGYGAVIVSSVFFALVHTSQYNDQANGLYIALYIILPMGLFLGYARLKSGSIFMPIILHMLNNLATCLTTHFQVY